MAVGVVNEVEEFRGRALNGDVYGRARELRVGVATCKYLYARGRARRKRGSLEIDLRIRSSEDERPNTANFETNSVEVHGYLSVYQIAAAYLQERRPRTEMLSFTAPMPPADSAWTVGTLNPAPVTPPAAICGSA